MHRANDALHLAAQVATGKVGMLAALSDHEQAHVVFQLQQGVGHPAVSHPDHGIGAGAGGELLGLLQQQAATLP